MVKELAEFLLDEEKQAKRSHQIANVEQKNCLHTHPSSLFLLPYLLALFLLTQEEQEKLGARLENEIEKRKGVEMELQNSHLELENLQERLKQVEDERDHLTVELRDSLAAYKKLSDRQVSLACLVFCYLLDSSSYNKYLGQV